MERRILIASRIKAARKQLGMSQTTLAKALGRSHVAISKIERGITKLEVTELDRLARALGRTLDYFTGDITSDIPPPITPEQLKNLCSAIPVAIPIISQEDSLQRPQQILGYAYWHQDEIGGREIIGLRIKDAPIPPLIENGDTVFFTVGTAAKSGNVVVIRVDNRLLVKRFYKRGETITLEDDAGVMKPDNCTIEGVVIQVCKKLSALPP